MASPKRRLYVGCSLTQAPEEFKNSVLRLKDALRAEGYEVLDFVGLIAGTPKDVYEWDIQHCVKKCDALLAICDYPAIGLGYELGEAVRLKKPVLAIAQNNAQVTRMLIGAAEVEPNLHFKRYLDFHKDILPMVKDWLISEGLPSSKS